MIAGVRDLLDVLFASLWQGACIAFVVAASLGLGGRRLNAATRYVILQVALTSIAIVPLVTTLPNALQQAWLHLADAVADSSAPGTATSGDSLPASRRIDVALSDRAVLMLTGVWIAGVLCFTLRIAAGSLQVARVIRRSRQVADRSGVRVFVSPDIGIPLATGLAAPAIVVPLELAARSREEFECIVLHELAHVRRGDAYGNAWICAIHALLYFNPAVSVILRAIALEREVACDDWAVAQSRDLATYTRSLASFALRRAGAGAAMASAASGFGRATVARIHRLEDTRRNGAIALSHNAVGGFTFVLLTIALTLNAFGPAVAFAPQASLSPVTIAATACAASDARYVTGPAPQRMRDTPKGLRTVVRVRLSASGKVMSVTLLTASGNLGFDRSVIAAAQKGTYAPQTRNCRPLAGSYTFDAMTG